MPKAVNQIKHCNGCDNDLPIDDFWNDASKWDGKDRLCKICRREYRRQYPHYSVHSIRRTRRKAVSAARHNGLLCSPQDYECQVCGRQAEQWHHWSYAKQYETDVIPLCTACHRRLHAGYFVLDLEHVQHVRVEETHEYA